MDKLDYVIEELVTANRILAHEGVVDSFGHISARHPNDPKRFLLSCARAPDLIESQDIMEFDLDGTAIEGEGRSPYLERFIHGALFEARSDIQSVVHNHSPSIIPFGVSTTRLKPISHTAACAGHEVPVWDIGDRFGDTSLLVEDMTMGRDLANRIGSGRAALMRGHGATIVGRDIRHAVYISIYLELNARLQQLAMQLGGVKYLSKGEVDIHLADKRTSGIDRAWQNWCKRSGRQALPRQVLHDD